jgi:hypothetical protein
MSSDALRMLMSEWEPPSGTLQDGTEGVAVRVCWLSHLTGSRSCRQLLNTATTSGLAVHQLGLMVPTTQHCTPNPHRHGTCLGCKCTGPVA